MYWEIGRYVSEKCENSGWGKSIVKALLENKLRELRELAEVEGLGDDDEEDS